MGILRLGSGVGGGETVSGSEGVGRGCSEDETEMYEILHLRFYCFRMSLCHQFTVINF